MTISKGVCGCVCKIDSYNGYYKSYDNYLIINYIHRRLSKLCIMYMYIYKIYAYICIYKSHLGPRMWPLLLDTHGHLEPRPGAGSNEITWLCWALPCSV